MRPNMRQKYFVAWCILLCCCFCQFVSAAHKPRQVVYGKYYKGLAKRDSVDNSYFLFRPPQNLVLSDGSALPPKLPVVFQVLGNDWIAGWGPFQSATPAISEYLSNGLAYVSLGYRSINRRYWYDDKQTGTSKMEELIHVSRDGKLSLDTAGRTMADYKARFSSLELVTKTIYDTVQGLENLITRADDFGLDIHRIVFFASSAGAVEVNYLTWVYHQWNVARYTPLGMMLITPQYDLPIGATDHFWRFWQDHSTATKLSQVVIARACSAVLGDSFCNATWVNVPQDEKITTEEICNATWNEKRVSNFCTSRFDSVTIAEVSESSKWHPSTSAFGEELGLGMEKLWHVSENMKHHHPKSFHLYSFSNLPDNPMYHSPLWVLAQAEQAARIGINYTVYYSQFPLMVDTVFKRPALQIASDFGPCTPPSLHYRSSVGWRDLSPLTKGAEPQSMQEHLLFICYVLGMTNCGPQDKSAPGNVSTDTLNRFGYRV